eukprot:COSAG01_NODE_1495_length_10123_cov_6.359537_8_plen_202_part_00
MQSKHAAAAQLLIDSPPGRQPSRRRAQQRRGMWALGMCTNCLFTCPGQLAHSVALVGGCAQCGAARSLVVELPASRTSPPSEVMVAAAAAAAAARGCTSTITSFVRKHGSVNGGLKPAAHHSTPCGSSSCAPLAPPATPPRGTAHHSLSSVARSCSSASKFVRMFCSLNDHVKVRTACRHPAAGSVDQHSVETRRDLNQPS